MSKSKSVPKVMPIVRPALPPIPYFSEWDPDALGRPIGLIAALAQMLLAWVSQGLSDTPRRFPGLPGPTVLHDELQRLGLPTTLQWPASCISVQAGDVCLVDYSKFPRDLVQDVNFNAWTWVIYLGMDDRYVYVNDSNWSGDQRDGGNALAIPLAAWELAFRAHQRGLACLRLVARGPETSLVDYHAPLTDEDRETLTTLAGIYGADDQPEVTRVETT